MAVINRMHDAKKSLVEAAADERLKFDELISQVSESMKLSKAEIQQLHNQCGINQLINSLNHRFRQFVNQKWRVKSQEELKNKLNERQSKVDALGKPPSAELLQEIRSLIPAAVCSTVFAC